VAPICVKDGTICVKNGTLQREKWHPCVKNGTMYVKSGTFPSQKFYVKNGTLFKEPHRHLREKWHSRKRPLRYLREKWHQVGKELSA
jgi:hypothetical protein